MGNESEVGDVQFAMQLLQQGRTDDEVVAALVRRGNEPKNCEELVRNLRRVVNQGLSPSQRLLADAEQRNSSRRRDRRLQRILLMQIRDEQASPELSAYSEEQQTYNKALLIDEELAIGEVVRGPTGSVAHAYLIEVTSKGHDFLDKAEEPPLIRGLGDSSQGVTVKQLTPATKTNLNVAKKVFISHSSDDADVAEAIIDLLCAALGLRRRDFLCTSVERLPTTWRRRN